MSDHPDNDPQTPENPVMEGLRDVIQCFSDWLDTKAPSNEKSYRILKALTTESLKKADRGTSQRQFHAEEITDAMGEIPWLHDRRPNDWIDWGRTAERFLSLQKTELQEFARQRGLKSYPWPLKRPTRGGPGNKAIYEIEALPLPANAPVDESPPPEHTIRYTSVPSSAIKPAWPIRSFFQEGEIRLSEWKRLVLIFLFMGVILLTFLLSFLVYIGLMEPRPITTREIANLIGMFAIPMSAWLWVIRPFTRLLEDRIILASDLLLAIDENPAQLELYKTDDVRVIRFTRYVGNCLICGASVQLAQGAPDYPRRLVGRCSECPREHVFSFDRVSRHGRVLMGDASICG